MFMCIYARQHACVCEYHTCTYTIVCMSIFTLNYFSIAMYLTNISNFYRIGKIQN